MEEPASAIPASIADATEGYRWARNTIGESGGNVFRLDAPDRPNLYLKHGSGAVAQDIVDEMVRLEWLRRHIAVPAVRRFVSTPGDAWLLMTAMPGENAFHCLEAYPERRAETVAALAAHLRAFHALPVDECPFNARHPLRMAAARRRMESGLVDADDFGDEHEGWMPEQVWHEMQGLLPLSEDAVVTHGDYSLDNILLENCRVSGCIDLGRVGVADRYQDIAILWNCLGEFDGDLQDHFARAYGVVVPDRRRIAFHLCLDEFF